MVRSFIRQKAFITGKTTVGMTVHKRFELLPIIWPEALFIHLLRDGRDVSYSSMKMGWYGNEWAATERWKEAISSYDELIKIVSPDNILEVRFERLVANSETELKRISNFIGVPYNDAFFDFAETSSYNIPKRNVASDWRGNFSELTTQLVESEIGDLLQRFGYELSGLDSLVINSHLRKKLEKENIRLKRIDRIRKYGFMTIALNKLADKIHLSPLKAVTQSRIDRIDRKGLK
jgi:hypothetical protein